MVLSFSWESPRKKGPRQLLDTALNRSRQYPLSIQFFYETRSESDLDEMYSDLKCFQLLMKQSYRWRHIYFDMPERFYDMLSPIQGHIPLLESLHLTLGDETSILMRDPWTEIAFAQAPSLKTVKFIGLSRSVNSNLPFSQIISFSDTRPYKGHELTRHLLSVLRDFPQLRSFEYLSSDFRRYTDPFFVLDPRVRNPGVHTLSACDCSFLRSLELPSLKEMELTTGTANYNLDTEMNVFCPPGALESLKVLIYNSDCALTKLTIAHARMNSNLIDILELSRTLSELNIQIRAWTALADDDVLRAVVSSLAETDDHGRHRVIPYLRSLSIEACSFVPSIAHYHATFFDRKFVEMISSRVKVVNPCLRSLNVVLQGQLEWSLTGGDEDRLNLLSKDGLRVHLEMDTDDSDSDADSDSDDLGFGF
ncbi:uncharacterized protein EV420DRAFT_1712846 [Desarmillaria tabescens]|uniref:F-box domain-containing protein n=1 Tax=Armillaria tabescens TaxID=1929756 RepID=A0AA39JU42_ARMTA|nr:uncharacterized protein EV420DRAFT_1712846 [Desarmillaria tabescens]KAK0447881.1 hypothetical protein EV420DRAFT_1712846 [Desarmillaria tabescens]